MNGGRGAAVLANWCSGTPASTTGWKGAERRCYLINMIDDATSRWFARFVTSDSTVENMNAAGVLREEARAAAGFLHRQGSPCFKRRRKRKRDETGRDKDRAELPPTQIGRALQELGIAWIPAHSPQAKGRVERDFRRLRIGW